MYDKDDGKNIKNNIKYAAGKRWQNGEFNEK